MLGIFLDTECNGLDPFTHFPIDIAFRVINLESGDCKSSYQSTIALTKEQWDKSDPQSLKINGFTWSEIQSAKKPDLVSSEIQDIFNRESITRKNAVFICQNPSFDRVFFSKIVPVYTQEEMMLPYHWLDLASMYWSKAIEESQSSPDKLPWITGFTKDRIASIFQVGPEKMPHKSMQGVDHLIKCYEALVTFPKRCVL